MNRASGFTLVELLLVAALLGLIAVIAAPRIPNTDREEKARAESFLLETFRTARQEALRSQATCGVRVDTGARRISFYRYDGAKPMAERKVVDDGADTTCLLHPVTRLPLNQAWGSGTDYPGLALAYRDSGFRGKSASGVVRKGDVQFDSRGLPWVFDGRHDPVPLVLPSSDAAPLLEYTVGALTGGLTVCPFTGGVALKRDDKDATDLCTL